MVCCMIVIHTKEVLGCAQNSQKKTLEYAHYKLHVNHFIEKFQPTVDLRQVKSLIYV